MVSDEAILEAHVHGVHQPTDRANIRIAGHHNVPLLSDELYYRRLPALLAVQCSTCVRTVGFDLLDQNLIARFDCSVLAALLANTRHGFVTTDAAMLLEFLGLENDEEDCALNLGGPLSVVKMRIFARTVGS